jgi:hypothetical protein
MEVTLFGIEILDKEVAPRNALSAMDVRVLGNVTDVRPVAEENAYEPIEVTPTGIMAVPTQLLLSVTTLESTLKDPLVPQVTV